MEYTVKIEDVTFGYGDRLILQNVSMKFGAGKVVAIMGGCLLYTSDAADDS